ncbi:hypothetical protein N7388_15520 [Stutzerimonas stutzeri]|uniref:hypothetical protein n=1 Tax=Stutzerimonas stutzeri TaxID=316 RepID=UPI002447C559|nr:hypothetical protein [Stutzerimonas stutzeri]MDH0445070.1 hypothetical protein [Stutzerimonas stutzeri]
MTALNKQELQIIQAFSSVDVPERIIRDSNIKELLHGMTAEQDAVQSDAQRLERLRQEKKDGNFIGNWWNDRDDKVQDAQIDLNKSIGRLTQKSSQLLIVNTAISKVLNDQQRILLDQQQTLKRQTDTLEEQNRKIFAQQKLLEKQQQDINQANQGLMEAKGLTQEQAQQLVGCVKLVKEAESRISVANQALRSGVEHYLNDSVAQCLGRLNTGFAEQEQRHADFEQQIISAFSTQSQQAQAELEHIAAESAQLKSALEAQLESTIAALGQHREAFEQQLTSAFSTQSQHAQAELERFASDTAEFKTSIGQQLQAHIQTVLEKAAAQDAAAQQLREAISAQLKKFQQDMVATVEQKVLALRETVKGVEQKQETAQQEQTQALQALQAQRESLERSLQHLEANLSGKAEALKTAEAQLAALQAEQRKSTSSNRLAVAAVACLALASLGWQVAQHFALI